MKILLCCLCLFYSCSVYSYIYLINRFCIDKHPLSIFVFVCLLLQAGITGVLFGLFENKCKK